jgi:hypothetical protein
MYYQQSQSQGLNQPSTANPPQQDSNHYNQRDVFMTGEDDDRLNGANPTETHPWQSVLNKCTHRKRHVETSTPDMTTTSNKYQLLDTQSDAKEADTEPAPINTPRPQEHHPPPIYIYGVTNYKAMIDSLALVVADEQYHTRTTKDNTVKVSPKTSDAYRKLIRHLREEQIVFHTYRPKEERAYRVIGHQD